MSDAAAHIEKAADYEHTAAAAVSSAVANEQLMRLHA
jgi:hypothetical protein